MLVTTTVAFLHTEIWNEKYKTKKVYTMPSLENTAFLSVLTTMVMLWLIDAGTLPICQQERAAWKGIPRSLLTHWMETSWNPFASSAYFGAHHRAYLECVYPIQWVNTISSLITIALMTKRFLSWFSSMTIPLLPFACVVGFIYFLVQTKYQIEFIP